MGLLDFFKTDKPSSANVASQRLRIIVAQERSQRNSPDYLPLMQREILEVIQKYVHVSADDVTVSVEKDGTHGVLELNVVLPD